MLNYYGVGVYIGGNVITQRYFTSKDEAMQYTMEVAKRQEDPSLPYEIRLTNHVLGEIA